jgi:hypothetical protein
MIQAALVTAREELAALETRKSELERQIATAEAALGDTPRVQTNERALTLHEAVAQILTERDNQWMSARELADEVNRRALYHKRDGSPVEANQIHARTNNYPQLFEKNDAGIRLRTESPMLDDVDPNIQIFKDDDEGFFEWLDANPDGYVINTNRKPTPNYLVLHVPSCPHFKGGDHLHWTKDYVKICSDSRDQLEEWAADVVGGEITLCPSCFGR